ncbi:MAG: type I-E CRISPR-associated protein Cse1/CasA [Chloroflexi bacterium]|nr:type I-E CRISPR-associated protein Cse1/CasA [Chloroflexota bacterium]
MTQPTFNLLDEPWIGAVDANGTLNEYSLRELLAQAPHLRALHDDSPLVIAAVLRMLLALLHRVYDGPRNSREWKAIWATKDGFDMARIERYFVQWHSRFDLFDSEHPFYQTIHAAVDKQTKSIASLLPELSTGNNATLFDHTTDANDVVLSAEEAARAVVAAQTFGLAGLCNPQLQLNFTDSTATRGMILIAEGNSIFETLVLNLIEYPAEKPIASSATDRPAWEMEDAYAPDREQPQGYLDYLTWQNRRLLLMPETNDSGIVVRSIALTPGLRLDATFLARDPMKHYRVDEKLGYLAKRFSEDRALWRDSAALLRFKSTEQQPPAVLDWLARLAEGGRPVLDDHYSLRCMALGMASNQAKIDFFRSEHVPLPPAYLKEPELVDLLTKALEAAENTASELWKASSTMAAVLLVPDEESGRSANSDDVQSLRDTMGTERRYWAGLEPLFRETMQALPEQAIEAMRRWFGWLREAAWATFEEVSEGLGDTPRALKAVVRGREQLAQGLGKVLNFEA